MLPELEKLLVVQDRDVAIAGYKKELDQIPKDIEKEKGIFKTAQAAHEALKGELKEREVEAQKLQLDRRTRQDTIEKLKVQQYETSKQEEISALGVEVKRYEGMVDELETSELEVMERCDALQSQVAESKEKLQKTYDYLVQFVEGVKVKAAELQQRVAEVQKDRDGLAKGVDSDLLERYYRLFKSKGDKVVVEMIDGKCTGCHMKVVPSTVVKVAGAKEIAYCENCGRILFES